MLGRSWLPPEITRLASDAASVGSRAELRQLGFSQPTHASFYAAAGQNSGFRFILSAHSQQRAEARTGSAAEPAQAANSAFRSVRPAFRQASGLDQDAFDLLLRDDLGELSPSAPPPRIRIQTPASSAGPNLTALMAAAAGGAVGGPASSFGPGVQGPAAPMVNNGQNGGGLGGGGAAASVPGGTLSATPGIPNLLTSGHFAGSTPAAGAAALRGNSPISANGYLAGPHGTVTPFQSGVVWPTDGLPTATGSGGSCNCACSGGSGGTASESGLTGAGAVITNTDTSDNGTTTSNPTNPTGGKHPIYVNPNPVVAGPITPVTLGSSGSGGTDATDPGNATLDNGGNASGDFMIDEAPAFSLPVTTPPVPSPPPGSAISTAKSISAPPT
jgi:hypothetical protein